MSSARSALPIFDGCHRRGSRDLCNLSVQTQASANFSLSLEPSKYQGRCWISFSPVLLSVVVMFPISLQAQASANVTISLSTEQVPGKITDWFQAQLRLCLYLFSVMVIFPIPLQAQASANVK